MKKRGRFIVIEGIGGSGKDTQARLLAKYLKKEGLEIVLTREHTRNTSLGRLIEAIIKGRKAKVDPLALQLLYVSDRRNHFMGVIKPSLEEGKTVIGNRYYSTSVAYCPEIWRKVILELNQKIVVRPDLVIIVDTSPEICNERMEIRGGADIFDKLKKARRCREGYLWYVKNSGDRCVVVNGNGTKEEVFEKVLKEIKKKKII
ncbi:MAG: dTMP kinase [Candidatus Shapirobacteria bacterium]|jgi:dTMP kinase